MQINIGPAQTRSVKVCRFSNESDNYGLVLNSLAATNPLLNSYDRDIYTKCMGDSAHGTAVPPEKDNRTLGGISIEGTK